MPSDMKEELNDTHNVYELNQFIDDLEAAKIGLLGGRKLKSKSPRKLGEMCLNDLVRKFHDLVDKTPIEDLQNGEELLFLIRRKICNLNNQANANLRNASGVAKFLTAIRSAFNQEVKSNMSREKLLNDIGNKIQDAQVQRIYHAEEIFDKILNEHHVDELSDLRFTNLKDKIINFLHQSSQETADQLTTALAMIWLKNNPTLMPPSSIENAFLANLIYSYRHAEDHFLKDFSSLLVAVYARVQNYESTNFSQRQHPINYHLSFSKNDGRHEIWKPCSEKSLSLAAEEVYKHMQSDESHWWMINH